MKIATAAVLLMNPDTTATTTIIVDTASSSLRWPSLPSSRPTPASAPVRRSPADSTNIAPTVTVATLENPARASWGVTRPDRASTTSTPMATASMGKRSRANSTSVTRMMP